MTIFLSIAFALSLSTILFGYWMDRAAVKAKINGANGLPILVSLIFSFLGSLVVMVIAGLFDGLGLMAKVAVFSVLYHIALATILISRLQSLATKIAEANRKTREHWENWTKKRG